MDMDRGDGDTERDILMSPGARGFPAGNPKAGWDPGRDCKSLEFPNFQMGTAVIPEDLWDEGGDLE